MTTPRQKAAVTALLQDRPSTPASSGEAFAPANIALCKYWGKRDAELNLPVTSSLSVSLGDLGTHTRLEWFEADTDQVFCGIEPKLAPPAFAARVSDYLDLFRPERAARFRVHTVNRIPTGAGFASSASGFAALVLALDNLFGWKLDEPSLSILARLGSGSACRSIFPGFAEWSAGTRADGMDSYAQPIPVAWPSLCLGLLPLETAPKPVGSRAGMDRTTRNSPLYSAWPDTVKRDLVTLHEALEKRDFPALGEVSECNALAMHATMLAARPPLVYWKPETLRTLHRVWALRADGLPLWFTMDAGPNVKLLFEHHHHEAVRTAFPEMIPAFPFGEQP